MSKPRGEQAIDPITDSTKGYPRPLVIWLLVLAFVIGGGLLVWLVPEPLLQNWLPKASAAERGKLLGTAAQIVLFGLGGMIAVVGVALSLSRHRQEMQAAALDREKEQRRRDELASQRRLDAERELRERFVTAVELISASSSPTKRKAAFYALAALADDWDVLDRSDEVQVCVDVICGYLRTPLEATDSSAKREEVEVRATAVRIVRSHLVDGAPHAWSEREIDLSGAEIDYKISLTDITIAGTGSLSFARVSIVDGGSVGLDELKVKDQAVVVLSDASISGSGDLSLNGAVVAGSGQVSAIGLEARGGGTVTLAAMSCLEKSKVSFAGASVTDSANFYAPGMRVSGDSRFVLDNALIGNDGVLALEGIHASDDARLSLDPIAVGASGSVSITGATASGASKIRVASSTNGVRGVLSVEDITVLDNARVYIDVKTGEGAGSVFVGTNTVAREGDLQVNGVRPSPTGVLYRADRPHSSAEANLIALAKSIAYDSEDE